ncbi:mating type protein MAT-2 [Gigaspora margarita]|uniref:Mating type protein MAT-2 n=1 Tax=Gigaspora margarita TaxID=4874 RepID=A0A8H4EKX8_GIGMA|nr:mating type protein MAT-2 [Gigaspora margarita]
MFDWKETEEVRFQWEKLDDRMKLEHMQDHPDYVYQPKKLGTKKLRKLSKSRDCNSSTFSSSSTTTFSTILPSDKNVSMADEAMITAIAESAFANSKFFLHRFFIR